MRPMINPRKWRKNENIHTGNKEKIRDSEERKKIRGSEERKKNLSYIFEGNEEKC